MGSSSRSSPWGLLPALVCGALLLGCAPRPYYEAYYPWTREALREEDRPTLAAALLSAAQKGRLERVELDLPEGRQTLPLTDAAALQLAALPLPVLGGLYHLRHPALRGAEWDGLVPVAGQGAVALTVFHEVDGRLRLQLRPQHPPTPEPPLSNAELSQRYGIFAPQGGDVPWDEAQRQLLDQALSLLSMAERPYLRGLIFYRSRKSEEQRHRDAAATYRTELGGGRVDIHDDAFSSDGALFCGEPGYEQPHSLLPLLHEVGHALADAPLRCLMRQYLADKAGLREQVSRLRGLAQQLDHSRTEAEAEALDREVLGLYQQFTVGLGSNQALFERLKAERDGARLLSRFRKVRGLRGGPTRYGRSNLDESFAEAFALFHVDPAALRRVWPEVYAWFAADEHLKAIGEALAGCQEPG